VDKLEHERDSLTEKRHLPTASSPAEKARKRVEGLGNRKEEAQTTCGKTGGGGSRECGLLLKLTPFPSQPNSGNREVRSVQSRQASEERIVIFTSKTQGLLLGGRRRSPVLRNSKEEDKKCRKGGRRGHQKWSRRFLRSLERSVDSRGANERRGAVGLGERGEKISQSELRGRLSWEKSWSKNVERVDPQISNGKKEGSSQEGRDCPTADGEFW